MQREEKAAASDLADRGHDCLRFAITCAGASPDFGSKLHVSKLQKGNGCNGQYTARVGGARHTHTHMMQVRGHYRAENCTKMMCNGLGPRLTCQELSSVWLQVLTVSVCARTHTIQSLATHLRYSGGRGVPRSHHVPLAPPCPCRCPPPRTRRA